MKPSLPGMYPELMFICLTSWAATVVANDDDFKAEFFIRHVVDEMVREVLNVDSLVGLDRRLQNIESNARRMEIKHTFEIANMTHLILSHVANPKATKLKLANVKANPSDTNERMANISNLLIGDVEPRKTSPVRCGGNIHLLLGVLQFEAPYNVPYSYTCVWSVNGGVFPRTNVTLAYHNFAESRATLRILSTPSSIWTYGNGTLAEQANWRWWNNGAKTWLDHGGGFVELTVPWDARVPPKFGLTFYGYPSAYPIGHDFDGYHYFRDNGSVEIMSIAHKRTTHTIVPEGSDSKEVNLVLTFRCGCTCGFLMVWAIGNPSMVSLPDGSFRFCEQVDSSIRLPTDKVGYILFASHGATWFHDWFSMAYYTIPSD